MLCFGGLALVLTLIAHDALMASAILASPVPQDAPLQFEFVSAHHAGVVMADSADASPLPVHPEGCGARGDAVPATSSDRHLVGDLASPLDGDLCLTPLAASQDWEEPFWPPSARRAWLQVYRI